MQGLTTSDYRGTMWPGKEDEDEGYPLYALFIFVVYLDMS